MCWAISTIVVLMDCMKRIGLETQDWPQDPQPDHPIEEILSSFNNLLVDQVVDFKPMLQHFAKTTLGYNDEDTQTLLFNQQNPETLLSEFLPLGENVGVPFFNFVFSQVQQQISCVHYEIGNEHHNVLTQPQPSIGVQIIDFPRQPRTMKNLIEDYFR